MLKLKSLLNMIYSDIRDSYVAGIATVIIFINILFPLLMLVDSELLNLYKKNLTISLSITILIFALMSWFLIHRGAIWLDTPQAKKVKGIEERLYARAQRFEKEARLALLATVIVVIGASVVFFKANDFAQDEYKDIVNIVSSAFADEAASSRNTVEQKAVPSGAPKVPPTDSTSARAIEQEAKVLAWLPFILILSIRTGDVAFASFLTFMLLRIYRYDLRLTAFYLSRADAFDMLAAKQFGKIKPEIMPIVLDANFDFGKDQASLSTSFAEIVRAIYPKGVSNLTPEQRPKTTKKPRRPSRPNNS